MKRISMWIASAALALGSGCALAMYDDQPVAVNVDHLQAKVAAEVRKHAAEGDRALARYMERTRAIHRLWFDDVTRAGTDREPLDGKAPQRHYRRHAGEWRAQRS